MTHIYLLQYLISGSGCAPPPLIGFVRARQRLSTLHSNRTTVMLIGPTYISKVNDNKHSMVWFVLR